MPWSRHPERAEPGVAPGSHEGWTPDVGPGLVATVLDPVLTPLGFASGQAGDTQVIFCRGNVGSPDGGCVDLVVELQAAPDWRIRDVRYWGFPSDRWQLPFKTAAPLAEQLADLAETLPGTLARG